jgi:hypothetical protein
VLAVEEILEEVLDHVGPAFLGVLAREHSTLDPLNVLRDSGPLIYYSLLNTVAYAGAVH